MLYFPSKTAAWSRLYPDCLSTCRKAFLESFLRLTYNKNDMFMSESNKLMILKSTFLQKKKTITALFINTRILRFKSLLTFAFFAAVNNLSGPLRKQVYFNGVQEVMVSDL